MHLAMLKYNTNLMRDKSVKCDKVVIFSDKTYLKVSLCGEGFLADGTLERLVPGMRAHMNLQGGRRGEVLIAYVAQVLGQACNVITRKLRLKHATQRPHRVAGSAAQRSCRGGGGEGGVQSHITHIPYSQQPQCFYVFLDSNKYTDPATA